MTRRDLRRYPEVARMVDALLSGPPPAVAGPDDLYRVVLPHLAGHEEERMVAVALDTASRVIDVAVLSTGSHRYTVFDPVQVLRWALTRAKVPGSIAVAHNHPSGDPTPSDQDLQGTTVLWNAARIVGVPLVDHIIVAGARHVSMASDHRFSRYLGGA